MKKKILFVGHTGRLGQAFIDAYADVFEVVGLSRSPTDEGSISANALLCNWDKMLVEAGEIDGVVYAPFLRPWNTGPIDTLTDNYIGAEITLQFTTLVRLIRSLKKYWTNLDGKSLVIVSSMSGQKPQVEEQLVYAAAKAAQISLAENAAVHLSPAKITALTPDRFPTKSLSSQDVARQVFEAL